MSSNVLKNNNKHKMCYKGSSCRFAALGNCFYAHSFDELFVEPCSYGKSCIFICVDSTGLVINNPKKHKVCRYLHISETKEAYHRRVKNNTPKENIAVIEPPSPVVIEPVKLTVSNEWTTIVKKKQYEDTRPIRVHVDDIHTTVTKLLDNKPKELSLIIDYD